MIDVAVSFQVGAFNLDVAFANNEGITALFGRSGSGKSTTVSLIAGLLRPSRGHIIVNDRVLVDTAKGVFVPMHRRRVGVVFQDSHLFPHLSVRQNLVFGRWFAARRARTVGFDAVIETLGIGHLLARRPARLSGGERQRVAIGRALLTCPDLLLFDEPFAALDLERRLEILPLIERLRDEFRLPILYVSHAVDEVARLAAYVVILEEGRLVAAGDPGKVLGAVTTGQTRFGRSSVLGVQVAGEDAAFGLTELRHPAGTIWLAGPAGSLGRELRIVVRATDVTLSLVPPRDLSVRSILAGTIAGIETEGPLAAVEIALDGADRLMALATRRAVAELRLAAGHRIFALVKTVALDERALGSAQS